MFTSIYKNGGTVLKSSIKRHSLEFTFQLIPRLKSYITITMSNFEQNKLNWGEKQQLQYSITNSLDDITAKPTGRVEFLLDVRDSIEYEVS